MGKEKFYEAKINYMNKRNRTLLAENEKLEQELAESKQYSNLLTFFLVIVALLSGLSLMAVLLNG
jgi:CHASE3 domain sensor protein